MTKFFQKINYSASNEDSFSEIEALDIKETDNILCITASWARCLDLLLSNPNKILSIDFNPAQNHLLELKILWYKYLDYEQFISFIWINKDYSRLEIYKKIKNNLSQEARTFWDNHLKIISKWVIYSWTWEKILISMSHLSFLRKKMINKLFSFNDIKEQKDYWNKVWCDNIFKTFLKICSSRFLWKYIIREPWVDIIDKDYNVYDYIKWKLDFLWNNFLLKDNDFANLIFLWKYKYNFPIHLRKEYFDIIKNWVDKIEIKTIWLYEVLDNKDLMNEITAISLSDFGSYSDDKSYNNIWEKIVKNTNSWTKFCERQFLIKRTPELFFSEIKRNFILEQKINKNDKTVFYTFNSWKIIEELWF